VTRWHFTTALPLLLLPWFLGALPRLVLAQGTRGWDERPTRELIDYLLKAPAR
jgi:hypothetical protein